MDFMMLLYNILKQLCILMCVLSIFYPCVYSRRDDVRIHSVKCCVHSYLAGSTFYQIKTPTIEALFIFERNPFNNEVFNCPSFILLPGRFHLQCKISCRFPRNFLRFESHLGNIRCNMSRIFQLKPPFYNQNNTHCYHCTLLSWRTGAHSVLKDRIYLLRLKPHYLFVSNFEKSVVAWFLFDRKSPYYKTTVPLQHPSIQPIIELYVSPRDRSVQKRSSHRRSVVRPSTRMHNTSCPPCKTTCQENDKTCRVCGTDFQGRSCNDSRCPHGLYGRGCSQKCPDLCLDHICHYETGHCFACKRGYLGEFCTIQCMSGYYGDGCTNRCSGLCLDERCDHQFGDCLACRPGYRGPKCNQLCPPETFGKDCLLNCSKACASECNRANGECLRCAAGYTGSMCSEMCTVGSYGDGCANQCPDGCLNNVCNAVDGKCEQCKEFLEGDICTGKVSSVNVSQSKNTTMANVVKHNNNDNERDSSGMTISIIVVLVLGFLSLAFGLGVFFKRRCIDSRQKRFEQADRTRRVTSPHNHNTRYSDHSLDTSSSSDDETSIPGFKLIYPPPQLPKSTYWREHSKIVRTFKSTSMRCNRGILLSDLDDETECVTRSSCSAYDAYQSPSYSLRKHQSSQVYRDRCSHPKESISSYSCVSQTYSSCTSTDYPSTLEESIRLPLARLSSGPDQNSKKDIISGGGVISTLTHNSKGTIRHEGLFNTPQVKSSSVTKELLQSKSCVYGPHSSPANQHTIPGVTTVEIASHSPKGSKSLTVTAALNTGIISKGKTRQESCVGIHCTRSQGVLDGTRLVSVDSRHTPIKFCESGPSKTEDTMISNEMTLSLVCQSDPPAKPNRLTKTGSSSIQMHRSYDDNIEQATTSRANVHSFRGLRSHGMPQPANSEERKGEIKQKWLNRLQTYFKKILSPNSYDHVNIETGKDALLAEADPLAACHNATEDSGCSKQIEMHSCPVNDTGSRTAELYGGRADDENCALQFHANGRSVSLTSCRSKAGSQTGSLSAGIPHTSTVSIGITQNSIGFTEPRSNQDGLAPEKKSLIPIIRNSTPSSSISSCMVQVQGREHIKGCVFNLSNQQQQTDSVGTSTSHGFEYLSASVDERSQHLPKTRSDDDITKNTSLSDVDVKHENNCQVHAPKHSLGGFCHQNTSQDSSEIVAKNSRAKQVSFPDAGNLASASDVSHSTSTWRAMADGLDKGVSPLQNSCSLDNLPTIKIDWKPPTRNSKLSLLPVPTKPTRRQIDSCQTLQIRCASKNDETFHINVDAMRPTLRSSSSPSSASPKKQHIKTSGTNVKTGIASYCKRGRTLSRTRLPIATTTTTTTTTLPTTFTTNPDFSRPPGRPDNTIRCPITRHQSPGLRIRPTPPTE